MKTCTTAVIGALVLAYAQHAVAATTPTLRDDVAVAQFTFRENATGAQESLGTVEFTTVGFDSVMLAQYPQAPHLTRVRVKMFSTTYVTDFGVWHIHVNPVGEESNNPCQRTGGHYLGSDRPYTRSDGVEVAEKGDLSAWFRKDGVTGMIRAGQYENTFYHENLPISEIIGKSIVVHRDDSAGTYLFCGNIEAVDDSYIENSGGVQDNCVEIVCPEGSQKIDFEQRGDGRQCHGRCVQEVQRVCVVDRCPRNQVLIDYDDVTKCGGRCIEQQVKASYQCVDEQNACSDFLGMNPRENQCFSPNKENPNPENCGPGKVYRPQVCQDMTTGEKAPMSRCVDAGLECGETACNCQNQECPKYNCECDTRKQAIAAACPPETSCGPDPGDYEVKCRCMQEGIGREVPLSKCSENRGVQCKPSTFHKCPAIPKCRRYECSTGTWGSCSVTCGGGVSSRSVECHLYEDDKFSSVVTRQQCDENSQQEGERCSTVATTKPCAMCPNDVFVPEDVPLLQDDCPEFKTTDMDLSTADLLNAFVADFTSNLTVSSGSSISASKSGPDAAFGKFCGGRYFGTRLSSSGAAGAEVGLQRGIVISTGRASDMFNLPLPEKDWGRPGPADDKITLQLEFQSDSATEVEFKYVFASRELPEYMGQKYNDEFSLELNGANIAKLATGDEVTINNLGTHPTDSSKWSPQYINNSRPDENWKGIPKGMTGFTEVMTATGTLVAGSNTLEISIWDRGDGRYDSAVFLQTGSLQASRRSGRSAQITAPTYAAPTIQQPVLAATGSKSTAATVSTAVGGVLCGIALLVAVYVLAERRAKKRYTSAGCPCCGRDITSHSEQAVVA